ncbi:dockerin type I domain-containing protein [Ruminococcus sp.]|uniref:dockerin type I domain-containing protein n=1 Tax=Ruminococcus sp. TaxID=41978 RepID=UPI002B9468CE|nr:dockerin type I domain-containing protein [Ruminococcus sp.]HNZ99594.1 hypothetical protein [Ruminococcus sp.]HOH86355.1 hypothetical protein [Ruminococcus sp.]
MKLKETLKHIIISASAACLVQLPVNTASAEDGAAQLPQGWLLWHSYSDYSALDSSLYLRSPDGVTETINGDFVHAMNGSFGTSPQQVVFMAIDERADERDIYLRDNGGITNLTENSGFRNEDPKFSPDGRSIVFKRGHWDRAADGFIYDLALMDVQTREVTMLTEDSVEEAMPCFSADGSSIYYAGYSGGIGAIYRLDLSSRITETIFAEEGVTAYYPVVCGDELYFTKWFSAEDHSDQIMRYDGSSIQPMAFDSADYDCSDPCPVGDGMVFSSTMNGGYDLYYFDGESVTRLSELSSDKSDLGAAFFPCETMGDVNGDGSFNTADVVTFQKWLLAVHDTELKSSSAADLCKDGMLDVFDLCAMRQALIGG